MRKITPLITIVVFFLTSFLYLHQKINIHVEAYALSENYQRYNHCVDKRDQLLYNFVQKVSLPKINQWAQNNDFTPVGKEQVLALNVQNEQTPAFTGKVAFLFNSVLNNPAGASTALARDTR